MRIVVNTPSGTIGRPLTTRLLEAGAHVTILSRSPEVADLVARGARLVEGSIDDEGAVARALEGADALFWLSPPAYRPDGNAWLVAAAQGAAAAAQRLGVRRVVVQSSMGAQTGPGTGPVGCLLAVEEAFRAIAPDVIALRAGLFMENLLRDLPSILGEGAIYSPNPTDKKLSLVATADVAARAAAFLLDASWHGHRAVGVHGPVDLSYRDVAQVLTQVLERPVRHVQTTLEQTRQGMLGAGLPDFVVAGFLELFEGVHNGRMASAEPRTQETTTATSLADFARAALLPAVRAAEGRVSPEAGGLISRVNEIMTAWELGDTETYRKRSAPGVRMTIPAYQLDVTGFEAIWGVRTSMKALEAGPLDLHTLVSHVVADRVVTAIAHVIDRKTGELAQHANVRFVLDERDRLVHYHQDIVWRRG
jgi:uncharacterized protein YbjT (DUF2867 family)